MQAGRRALQHFHALDQFRRNGYIERIVPGMEIRERDPVQEYQHLVERTAAHADIRLGTVRSARSHINPGQILQNIRYGLDRQGFDLGMRDLSDQTIGFRMNFSFVRNDQHLLKTKLLGG